MRVLFWLVLLANVAVFALIRQGWVWHDGGALQPLPSFNEDKVLLLDDSPALPSIAAPAPLSSGAMISNPPSAVSQPSAAVSSPATEGPGVLSCLEWGDFSGTELRLVTAALSAMRLGDRLDKRQVDQVIRYWVYIPPLKSKAAIQQKIAQLKTRGIEEYFIVPDSDPWRGAISLGVFKTEEAAKNYLKVLRDKDVRSARVGARAGKQKATIFVLKGVDSATESRIGALKKDFPGSELKNVPCAH
jgi:hypothetical protein